RRPELHRHVFGLVVARPLHRQRDGVARLVPLEHVENFVERGDRLAADAHYHVAHDELAAGIALEGLDARRGGAALRQHAHDRHALVDAELALELQRRDLDAQRGPHELAFAYQSRHDAIHLVHGDGEANADRGAGRAVDGGVDADQPPRRIEKRAARVARIDRGVGLDHAADLALSHRVYLAVERADDARRQGLVEAEGVADRVDLLPHLQVLAGAY